MKRYSATVVFVIRHKKGGKRELLLGIKGRKIGKGKMMPPGGRFERGIDVNHLACAQRETKEESGLLCHSLDLRAKTTIRRTDPKTKERKAVVVYCFVCEAFSGRIRCKRNEWRDGKFYPWKKIPWDKMLAGDPPWIKRILDGEKLDVTIHCGAERSDFIRSVIRPLDLASIRE